MARSEYTYTRTAMELFFWKRTVAPTTADDGIVMSGIFLDMHQLKYAGWWKGDTENLGAACLYKLPSWGDAGKR
jgi:hypothetical protein